MEKEYFVIPKEWMDALSLTDFETAGKILCRAYWHMNGRKIADDESLETAVVLKICEEIKEAAKNGVL